MHKETDDDGMKNYITNKCVQDFNLSLLSNVNAMFKLYKLSISISELNKVVCAEMCPSGVYVQRWRGRNTNRTDDEGQLATNMHLLMASNQQLNLLNKLTCITCNSEYADHSTIDFIKSLFQQCDFL